MLDYCMRSVCADDYQRIAEIYNSNRSFLVHHLGVDRVDDAFVAEECGLMRSAGFSSCAIVNPASGAIHAILDFRPGGEAYLSLIMLDAGLQGLGMGSRIYADFERRMRRAGSRSIRIDVVNDYPGNAEPFWKAQGFIPGETITLKWRSKTSRAVVMHKAIEALFSPQCDIIASAGAENAAPFLSEV